MIPESLRHTGGMDQADLRARLVETEERIERIGIRFTAGYGTDSDRANWLAWLRHLEARRSQLLAELAALAALKDVRPSD